MELYLTYVKSEGIDHNLYKVMDVFDQLVLDNPGRKWTAM
jgi:hypothetical protein